MDDVFTYAAVCYDFDVNNAESVNSGTNRVYKIRKDGQNFYLRISTSGFDFISAEIHWIEYLRTAIKVPELVKSRGGKSIETFEDESGIFVICMFRELPGVYWDKNDTAIWNDETFFKWGKIMGCMHRMSKNYRPPDGVYKRPTYEENFNPLENYVAVPTLYEKMARIQSEISELPKDANSYGFIHSDVHQQNFLINENDLSVLDFDSSQYGFFAHDIGISLYHAIWWGFPDNVADKNDYAMRIIKNFMSGYKTENTLSDFWLKKIILFMKYRQIEAFSWHLGVYPSKGFTAVVYNELFKIHFNFPQYIKDIENDVFYEGCTINEKSIV